MAPPSCTGDADGRREETGAGAAARTAAVRLGRVARKSAGGRPEWPWQICTTFPITIEFPAEIRTLVSGRGAGSRPAERKNGAFAFARMHFGCRGGPPRRPGRAASQEVRAACRGLPAAAGRASLARAAAGRHLRRRPVMRLGNTGPPGARGGRSAEATRRSELDNSYDGFPNPSLETDGLGNPSYISIAQAIRARGLGLASGLLGDCPDFRGAKMGLSPSASGKLSL